MMTPAVYDPDDAATIDRQQKRIAELEAALREIADGQIDEGGNRRNHDDAAMIARRALTGASI